VDALGRSDETLPVRVLTDLAEDATDGGLDRPICRSPVGPRHEALDLGNLEHWRLADLRLDLVDDSAHMLRQLSAGRTGHDEGSSACGGSYPVPVRRRSKDRRRCVPSPWSSNAG